MPKSSVEDCLNLSSNHTDLHTDRQRRLYWAVGLMHVAAICLLAALYLYLSGSMEVTADKRFTLEPAESHTRETALYGQMFELSQSNDGMILLAAKSTTGKLSSKKKKAQKIKKRPSRSKSRSGGGVRKKVRTSSIDASRKRVAADFIEFLSIGIVGFALLGLYLRHQKEFGESTRDLKELAAAPVLNPNAYEAKAVVLSDPTGPDPMTFERTDVFAKVAGKGRRKSVALDLAMDGPELDVGISNEIDDIISSIKIKDELGGELPPPTQMLLLPAEMQGHFEGFRGETLEWSAPLYIKGVCEGVMAITSHRVLALYERRSVKLWLPSIIYQTKRNQTPLEQISLYKAVQVNRPSFLAVGASIFWWFPFGTVGACITIAGFLLLTRRELGIWTKGQKRTFPLSMVDMEEAMSSIGKMTGVQALGRTSEPQNGQKAG